MLEIHAKLDTFLCGHLIRNPNNPNKGIALDYYLALMFVRIIHLAPSLQMLTQHHGTLTLTTRITLITVARWAKRRASVRPCARAFDSSRRFIFASSLARCLSPLSHRSPRRELCAWPHTSRWPPPRKCRWATAPRPGFKSLSRTPSATRYHSHAFNSLIFRLSDNTKGHVFVHDNVCCVCVVDVCVRLARGTRGASDITMPQTRRSAPDQIRLALTPSQPSHPITLRTSRP
jgi:hypothetical protein